MLVLGVVIGFFIGSFLIGFCMGLLLLSRPRTPATYRGRESQHVGAPFDFREMLQKKWSEFLSSPPNRARRREKQA
jgi:hypothetical protein